MTPLDPTKDYHFPPPETWQEQRERVAAQVKQVRHRLATWERLRVTLERASEVVHQLHPNQYAIPVGRGICKWAACRQIRAALEATKEE